MAKYSVIFCLFCPRNVTVSVAEILMSDQANMVVHTHRMNMLIWLTEKTEYIRKHTMCVTEIRNIYTMTKPKITMDLDGNSTACVHCA